MDNFRDSYFPITWDLTQKHLRGTFWGKQYDTGRGFAVTIVEGGKVTVPSTETVRLKWEKPDGTEGYVTAVVVDGKFIIEDIDQMFTVHGAVRSDLEIWRGGKVISSITFYVSVEKAVAVDAIESSSQFTALQEALADVGDMQAQVDAVIANATVDSEVILARGTEPTLGARLDAEKAEFSAHKEDYASFEKLVTNTINEFANVSLGIAEQGGILTSTGLNDVSIGNRVRTKDYIKVDIDSVLKINVENGYKYIISFYDSGKNYVGSAFNTQDSKFFTTNTYLGCKYPYIKVQIGKSSDGAISVNEMNNISIYIKSIGDYSEPELNLTFGAINSVTGVSNNYATNRINSGFIEVRDYIYLSNQLSYTSNFLRLSVDIFQYDEFLNYIGSTGFMDIPQYRCMDVKEKLINTNCKYIRFAFKDVIVFGDGLEVAAGIKCKVYNKNKIINFSDFDIITKELLGIKTITSWKKGLYNSTNAGYANLSYSICTNELIHIPKGSSVFLKDYSTFILTMRFMINGNMINSVELKDGVYTFDEDCDVYFNILAFSKVTNTPNTSYNVDKLISDIGSLLCIISPYTPPKKEVNKGVANTVEKAYAIHGLKWTPLNNIPGAGTTFQAGTEYNGIPYSSARVTDTFVGSDILLNTFLSALKNPNSVIYTENLKNSPYYQPNATAYYGMVCSTFVAYCLGIPSRPTSVNWSNTDGMKKIKKSIDNVEIGDSLLYQDSVGTDGHVMLITNVSRDINDVVTFVEVCESTPPTIARTIYNRTNFVNVLNTYDIYRYSKIGESLKDNFDFDFTAEGYLNTDYGNYANYRVGKDVKVTVFNSNYSHILVYKNDILLKAVVINQEGVTNLSALDEGIYKICLSKANTPSDISPYIYFNIVDDNTSVVKDGNKYKITLNSNSGSPSWFSWNDNTHVVFKCREITGDEKSNGYIHDDFRAGNWKVKVYYENDYGIFSSNPVDVIIE